jgi:4-amino-4-deoxy-L-arabinose transferase-like glycosyltransferase
LAQLANTPYLHIDNIDSKGYQVWAQQILAGDWLPRRHFYQSPLYAYYLAFTYGLFGTSTWTPRIIQILLGSCSAAFLYGLGTKLFSRRAGAIAAVLIAVYGPVILEEIVLAKTALVICGGLSFFTLLVVGLPRRGLPLVGAAGAVLGLTIVGSGQWLPVLLATSAYVAFWSARPAGRRRASLGGALLAGGLAVILPVAAWNSYWGGGLILTSADAGLNLYIGNNALTTGLPGRPRGVRDVPEFEEADSRGLAEQEAGMALTPAATSRYWSRRALAFVVQNPSRFLVTVARKFIVLWNCYEIPDSYQYTFMRAEFVPGLRGCQSFATVGPLALLGMVLFSRRRSLAPLYLVTLVYLGTVLMFYVRARYRMPAVPFLILFAAAAVDWLMTAVTSQRWKSVAAGAVGLCAAAAFVNLRYCEPAHHGFRPICLSGDAWFDLEWMKLAEWHTARGDREQALAYLYRAAAGSSLRSPGQLHFQIGNAELRRGVELVNADRQGAFAHLRAADAAFRRCVTEGYRTGLAYVHLSVANRTMGLTQEADQALESARRLTPNGTDALLWGEQLNVELGLCAEARQLFAEIEHIAPNHPHAHRLLQACTERSPP